MMRPLLIILTLLTVQLFGQSKRLVIPTNQNGDTTLWVKFRNDLNKKVGLESLFKSNDSLRIRLSIDNKIVEIWTNDYVTFNGQQVLYTSSYDPDGNRPSKFYSSKKPIGPDTSKLIFSKIDSVGILGIPEQDSIKGWPHGADGYTYIIESSNPTTYVFRSYWTPSSFEEIPEARMIDTFENGIDGLLRLTDGFELFLNTLPSENCYRIGSMSIRCPVKKVKMKRNG